jgi:hypothetical protein
MMTSDVTGTYNVHNQSDNNYYVVDGENKSKFLSIPPNDSRSFGGVAVPWCDNVPQILDKAFTFFGNAIGRFYLFQTGVCSIFWTSYAAPSYEKKIPLGPGSSSPCYGGIDVFIRPDHTPMVVAS